MSPLRVALTLRVVRDPRHGELREAISRDWLSFLAARGVTPLLIPAPVPDPADLIEQLGAAGLVLTNGNDIGPAGGGPGEGPDVDACRDAAEGELLDRALERDLPVLAVCRGLQRVVTHSKGPLARIPDGSHAGSPHTLAVVSPTLPRELDGATVNSFHDLGVATATLPDVLEPLATSPGGEWVEALRHRHASVWGMQWHPERPGAEAASGWFVDRFLDAVARHGARR